MSGVGAPGPREESRVLGAAAGSWFQQVGSGEAFCPPQLLDVLQLEQHSGHSGSRGGRHAPETGRMGHNPCHWAVSLWGRRTWRGVSLTLVTRRPGLEARPYPLAQGTWRQFPSPPRPSPTGWQGPCEGQSRCGCLGHRPPLFSVVRLQDQLMHNLYNTAQSSDDALPHSPVSLER